MIWNLNPDDGQFHDQKGIYRLSVCFFIFVLFWFGFSFISLQRLIQCPRARKWQSQTESEASNYLSCHSTFSLTIKCCYVNRKQKVDSAFCQQNRVYWGKKKGLQSGKRSHGCKKKEQEEGSSLLRGTGSEGEGQLQPQSSSCRDSATHNGCKSSSHWPFGFLPWLRSLW